jgi:hypothetical protein
MKAARRQTLIAAALAGAVAMSGFATRADAQESAAELAEKLSNPVAALISVPLQLNYDDKIGSAGSGRKSGREIKEWQAIMDHLRRLPVKNKGELPVIPVDERANEVRAIKA